MSLSNYRKMKALTREKLIQKKPTLTDQAAASETDINVVVPRFLRQGGALSGNDSPMSGDFTNLPDNLRDMIELTREMGRLRQELPQQLRTRSYEDLASMTYEQAASILTPPAPPPDEKKEEKK